MADETLHAILYKGPLATNFLGHQAEEILKHKIYAPYLESVKDAVVIDVGGNIGLFSLYASEYAKQIYTLEPDPKHADTIRRMVEFNKLDNIKVIEKALYFENTKLPFYEPEVNQTMASLYASVGPQVAVVETVDLPTLFEQEKIDHVNLMKFDCEGSEGEILGGAGFSAVADKIDVIVGELHSWGIRPKIQVLDALKNRGFKVEQPEHDADLFIATK